MWGKRLQCWRHCILISIGRRSPPTINWCMWMCFDREIVLTAILIPCFPLFLVAFLVNSIHFNCDFIVFFLSLPLSIVFSLQVLICTAVIVLVFILIVSLTVACWLDAIDWIAFPLVCSLFRNVILRCHRHIEIGESRAAGILTSVKQCRCQIELAQKNHDVLLTNELSFFFLNAYKCV